MWIAKVVFAAAVSLGVPLAGAQPELPSPKTTLALMHRVNEWQKAHPVMPSNDRNWQRATWYTGVMEAWKATRDKRFLTQALDWGRQHDWQPGTEVCGSNRLFCSQTWLELYFLDKRDRARIEPTIRWLEAEAPNSPAGARRWYLERDYSYVDSLYGSAALAMLHRATGETRYLEILRAFFDDVSDELLDKDAGLYYRDNRFIGKTTAAGRKILWSRGNGWAFAGFARLLEYLPESDSRRRKVEDIYRRMAAELVRRQGADGFWRPNLDDPEDAAVPETSGTGFFCFGLGWGIRNGLLDRAAHLPALIKGWKALESSVDSDGRIRWGQLVGDRPVAVAEAHTHEYVTGTFLLAGGEVYRLRAGRAPGGGRAARRASAPTHYGAK